jgi:hypothetical protein
MYFLFIILIILIAIYNILFKPGLSSGIKWLIISFFLGYRTITVAPGFLLHPIDIIIFTLFFKALLLPNRTPSSYPIWLIGLIPFTIWGLFVGLNNTWNAWKVWFDFKNFALIFPIFYILDKSIQRDEDFPPIAYTQILVITAIALFGLLEYYVPSFRQVLSGFYNPNVENGLDAQGFKRASFTFWGAITVGHIMIIAMPLIYLVDRKPALFPSLKIFLLAALILNIGAFYIMGNRADWLTFLMIAVLFYFLIYKRKASFSKRTIVLSIIILGALIVLPFLDQAFVARFMTGVEAITSTKEGYDAADSSGYIRQQRLFNALDIIRTTPLGVGWSRSGWVHSDFVQITANIGWLGGGLFFAGYINSVMKTYNLRLSNLVTEVERDTLSITLISLIAIGFMLSVNNHYQLSQSGVPLFFLWSLSHIYATKLERELRWRRSIIRSKAQRSPAHLQ